VCEWLMDRGDDVVCVDNLITGSAENVGRLLGRPGFSLLAQDVSTPIDVPGSVDSIFHLASPASPRASLRHPIETLSAGSLGTHNCLELAKDKRARFLLASTSEVYGDPQVHPTSSPVVFEPLPEDDPARRPAGSWRTAKGAAWTSH
jgi:dTDP-glucose 4,6-dehydratase